MIKAVDGRTGSDSKAGRSEHESLTAGPALVGANWYRFRPEEHIRHGEVASVSFVWPVHGTGVIRSRGETFRLDPTVLLRLPWRHDVDYRADARSPFHVGTIHLVPRHDADEPVEARVAHLADDPLLHSPIRHGPPVPETPVLLSRLTPAGRRLVELGSYAVERFHDGELPTAVLRALGVLLAEADASRTRAEPRAAGRPVALESMTSFVLENLDRSLAVAEIAAAGGCSVATAERLFARHTGQSVIAWARRRQLEEAALLLRTTGLRVGEVAARVGFPDPLYFSRSFRALFSVPPSRYASEQLRP
ncbi:MAG: helix-turn-helix transcriptional regulator [Actinoallomurus sp.]